MTLARLALGEVTHGEVAELKAEISELESFLPDKAWTLQGLNARKQVVKDDMLKARKVIDRHKAEERYEEIKSQLEIEYCPRLL